jgi:hypothetical protein
MVEIITRDEAIALGLRMYFDGQPCKHGHIVERYVNGNECLECQDVACANGSM